jgi:cell division protein FtsL
VGRNTKNLSLIAAAVFIAIITIMIGVLIYWLWGGFTANVNVSGNSTIAADEISARSVPSIINGITTATGIIIAFSIAISALLIGYLFKDNDRERNVIIVILSVFPIPMIFQFFAYITLAGGQGLFGIALRLDLVSFLYSIFALMCIFIFASFRMYEREKNSRKTIQETQPNQPPEGKQAEHSKTKNSDKKAIVIAIISLLVSSCLTVYSIYLTTQANDVQNRLADLQSQSNALQNKLYNYTSIIYSSNPYESTLIDDSYTLGSDSICVFGQVSIDLQVSTPYPSCALRISLENISFAPTGFIDWSRRNESLLYTTDPNMAIAIPIKQGWNNVPIEPWVTLACCVNPQVIKNSALNSTIVEFPLGSLVFNATLIDTSTNQTITNSAFSQYVYAQLDIAKIPSS